MRDTIADQYLDWMMRKVTNRNTVKSRISYRKLFIFLNSVDFVYTLPRDENRYSDGVCLRYRFLDDLGLDQNLYSELDGPCSVLEMMVALSIRCEESIMSNDEYGDRTPQWFWGMINTLGLGWMSDDKFDHSEAEEIIDRFLNHEYSKNGKGGLFYIRNSNRDVRKLEIWAQMCRYLDGFDDGIM